MLTHDQDLRRMSRITAYQAGGMRAPPSSRRHLQLSNVSRKLNLKRSRLDEDCSSIPTRVVNGDVWTFPVETLPIFADTLLSVQVRKILTSHAGQTR